MITRTRVKNLITLLFVFIGNIFFASCGTAVPQTVFELKINANSQAEIEKDGLFVRVKPVIEDNYSLFPKLYTHTKYKHEVLGTMLEKETPYILVTLPAFEVTFTNNTGHVIRLSNAAIRLVDNFDESYEPLMKPDLKDNIDIEIAAYESEGYFFNSIPLKAKTNMIKVVDRNFELLPNMTSKGYVVFNYPVNTEGKEKRFLSNREYLKLMLYEIPTITDDAGGITKTTNFEFIFDIKSKVVQPK